MKKIYQAICCVLFSMLFIVSCKDDEPEDPIIPNEEEIITTLTYTLTPTGGGSDVVLYFQDLDGDGGDPPTINGGTLVANTSYTGSLELLNESESPTIDISEEILEEAEEHQFFFQTSIVDLTIDYTDMDSNGFPIGLSTTLSSNDVSSGELTIILKHEPEKDASGVSTGDITNAGGETDIEISFSVEVQ